MNQLNETVRILGIDFFNGSLERALEFTRREGGLVLAPSGPGLSELGHNPLYDCALQNADLNLVDSAYLALLWKRRTGQIIQRHSGLKFIKALIEDSEFQKCAKQLWVMPSADESSAARAFLKEAGIRLQGENFYAAPYYTSTRVTDETLLASIRLNQPRFIILAIAGGKQEVLGHWLRQQLEYKPAIICIGAAIAFLSGQQANIPSWADRIYIGWLLRILKSPRKFFPRYWKARKLSQLLNRYGQSPPAAPV